MKARAWLLMLFIGMMSFTGFSTTSDLNQNSSIIVTDNDVGELINVETQHIVLVEVFVYKTETHQMVVQRFKQEDCEYLKFGESTPIKPSDNIVDDVGWRKQETKNNHLHTRTDFSNKLIYRSPRDAIRIV